MGKRKKDGPRQGYIYNVVVEAQPVDDPEFALWQTPGISPLGMSPCLRTVHRHHIPKEGKMNIELSITYNWAWLLLGKRIWGEQ